jgi:hypothetical protein
MKIGDKVKVKDLDSKAFQGSHGQIVRSMLPDYQWAVEIDGMSMDSDDLYGFNESELEVI